MTPTTPPSDNPPCPACGLRPHRIKVTDAVVKQLRAQHAAGTSTAKLAREHQLSRLTVVAVVTRQGRFGLID